MSYIGHPHSRTLPDPNDRTANDPAVLVDSRHVRAFVQYEAAAMNRGKDKGRIVSLGLPVLNADELDLPTVEVRRAMVQWYAAYAVRVGGWPHTTVLGMSVLLHTQPLG